MKMVAVALAAVAAGAITFLDVRASNKPPVPLAKGDLADRIIGGMTHDSPVFTDPQNRTTYAEKAWFYRWAADHEDI